MLENKIRDIFRKKFGKEPEVIVKSPGRINIIGEHTDYNLGYVLPAAIENYMFIGLSKNDSGEFNLYSLDYNESFTASHDTIKESGTSWLNLVYGVIHQLKDDISGFDLVFCGDIPEGAGLSSSAALCCGTGFGISRLFDLNIENWDIAKIAQKSEHDFAHVQCGIMDQFACIFGLTNHVLLLDCLDLSYKESPIDISGHKFVLINSNVKHELNESDYNARRKESAKALEIIQSRFPEINSYRDVTESLMNDCKSALSGMLWKRAYHIVSENQRVLDVNDSLRNNNLTHVGELLTAGHHSLKDNYEVTCPETDFLVEELIKDKNFYGARQVGGGFGGCVLAIAKDANINEVLEVVNKHYKREFRKKITKIPIRISKGCHVVD